MSDPVKLCSYCHERPAECMGELCIECDHMMGDQADPEAEGEDGE